MKKMILILTMLFSFAGCRQEEPEQQLDTNSIYGTWQLVERHHVLPSSVQNIDNGEIIILNIDGKFSSEFYLCEGVYEDVGDSTIEVNFNCIDKIIFSYIIKNNTLELQKPFGWEGGYDKYKKISEPELGD